MPADNHNTNHSLAEFRYADVDQIAQLKSFLLEHGPNQWNYLPVPAVDAGFQLMHRDQAMCISCYLNSDLAGLALSFFGDTCPEPILQYHDSAQIMFISEVVVSPNYAGHGLGTDLLQRSLDYASAQNLEAVYIERHEENLASAGMMRKAGFKLIDTFHDPAKRSSGSCNSCVLRYQL